MLDSFKRIFSGATPAQDSWPELQALARQRQWAMRLVREPHGFVIDGRTGSTAWRMEWGPSQRPYIRGSELRLRAELDVPRDLQALVLSHELMETMERDIFERYVEGVQTRIDTETPAEMRWLVMYPKLPGSELPALRERFGALASCKPWLLQWLAGDLTAALAGVPRAAELPLVLIVARRRLSLRTAMPQAEPELIQRWLQLFDCALNAERRVTVDFNDQAAASTTPSLFTAEGNADALQG